MNTSVERLSSRLEEGATAAPANMTVLVIAVMVLLFIIALIFHLRVIKPWIESVLSASRIPTPRLPRRDPVPWQVSCERRQTRLLIVRFQCPQETTKIAGFLGDLPPDHVDIEEVVAGADAEDIDALTSSVSLHQEGGDDSESEDGDDDEDDTLMGD